MLQQGEIYWANFPDAGMHPVIIISRTELNQGNYVLVIVCTSARFEIRRNLPNCVPFQAGQYGLTRDCVAQCENILSVEQTQLNFESGPISVLDEVRLHTLIKAIGYVIDADCELL